MGIENHPIIQDLENFAQLLPEEHRAKLYTTVKEFLKVGAMHGTFEGLTSFAGVTPEEDQQRECIAYLSAKAEEYSTK